MQSRVLPKDESRTRACMGSPEVLPTSVPAFLLHQPSQQSPVGQHEPPCSFCGCFQGRVSFPHTLPSVLPACSCRQHTGMHSHTTSVLPGYSNSQQQLAGMRSELAPPSCRVPSLHGSSWSPSWSWKLPIITSNTASDFSNKRAFASWGL